ncbi:MAG: DUF1667 domain-containing protein [Oscillospiraceae bacterium]|jgi:CxxC motif-containing protein|nr:DUF1667 domain-containing protein [Oscillospiraceae bacterium]
MQKKLICINCPIGCEVTAETTEGGEIVFVTGNACKRGDDYVRSELTNPSRIVTSLVKMEGYTQPLSVKTAAPIPKEKIAACVAEIHRARVTPPIRIGDAVVRDVCGTGVDVVATKDVG